MGVSLCRSSTRIRACLLFVPLTYRDRPDDDNFISEHKCNKIKNVITKRHNGIFFFTGSTAPLGPGLCFFSFMIILQTVGLLGRVISSSLGLYLNTGQHKHRISTYTHQTSMSCVGLEPTIPASERAKTVHALDRSATVTGDTMGCYT
jgi:hypothetical protein